MVRTVEVGDSISKVKGENTCTVYKPDGRILNVKFIYIQAETNK